VGRVAAGRRREGRGHEREREGMNRPWPTYFSEAYAAYEMYHTGMYLQ